MSARPREQKPTRIVDPQRRRSSEGEHVIDLLIGKQLRAGRELQDFSQSDLADACGITFQQIQRYEKSFNRISVSRLLSIARALDLPVAYFLRAAAEQAGVKLQ